MDNETQHARGFHTGAVVAGAILLGVGTTMLLNSTGVVDIHFGRLIGPLVLIAIGTSMVLGQNAEAVGRRDSIVDDTRRRHRRRGGATGGIYMIGLGIWMMVSQTHLFGLTFATSWPLLIILSGFMIVIRGMR
jgi:Domain of unknown function (DUF5668)